jgi:hypothetical protein
VARDGRRRTEGTVVLGDGTREVYWFDVPEGRHCGESGDAWAIALLPLAMTRGERLEIPLPVDPLLSRNFDHLQGVWRAWWPALSTIEVRAPAAAGLATGPRVVSCFSGGLDSLYTLIRNHDRFPPGHARRITDLMLVHGADVPVEDAVTFGRLKARYAALAGEFGVRLVDPRTNFRSGSLGRLSWSDLTHAPCLAACAAMLGADYGCLLIPSGAAYRAFRPWGSTPLTDPLLSMTRLRVEHDGAELSRPEKTEVLSTHPVVQRQIRVCWRSGSDQNCGRCAKCLRTMASLEAVGRLDAFSAFPREHYSHDAVGRIYCRTPSEYLQLRQVHGMAVLQGRTGLARALRRALGRSERIHTVRMMVGFLEGVLGIRVLGPLLERRVLSRSILD